MVLAAWKESAGKDGSVLVEKELTSGTSSYLIFAYPIFVGEPATAAGAIAIEPPAARQGYVVLGYDLAPVEWFKQQENEKKVEAVQKAALYTGAVGALF